MWAISVNSAALFTLHNTVKLIMWRIYFVIAFERTSRCFAGPVHYLTRLLDKVLFKASGTSNHIFCNAEVAESLNVCMSLDHLTNILINPLIRIDMVVQSAD